MAARDNPFAALPGVDTLLGEPRLSAQIDVSGREAVATAARDVLDAARAAIRDGGAAPAPDALVAAIAERVGTGAALVPVLNLTGTILHTNLGRAVLAEPAIEAMREAAGAVNLEFDLESGQRGDRDSLVEARICQLTGAEAATVVNNNAAAVLLALHALAAGREVLVSRGELIEIGGSFRIPDVMRTAGCTLREIGTTNRTHPRDYEQAIGADTALICKVHPSNYRIEGFTSGVAISDLAPIARQGDVPLMYDLGSGTLTRLDRMGLPREETAREVLDAGADLITFSGDKLLGGPQCGVIAGRRDLLDTIRSNPMKRALRVSKVTLAALAATLRLYEAPDRLGIDLPLYRALTRELADLERTGAAIISACPGIEIDVVDSECEIGSGALPREPIPSRALALTTTDGADATLARLRAGSPPVVGRIENGRVLLDLRHVEAGPSFDALVRASASSASERMSEAVAEPVFEPLVVATAGHVDHGKTSLVRAMTGVDTDRLADEKARGLTIDLGFAYCDFEGRRLGFIDVPGHRRFITNMLAGVSGIDVGLLVIAADDSVMPQTREHLTIMQALGTPELIVAVSKCDRVEPGRVTEVEADIRALLADTAYADAELVPTSSEDGTGVDDLMTLLAATEPAARRADRRFRLAVDRVFSLRGAGLVVTGTVFDGSASVGESLRIAPQGPAARLRSAHAQNAEASTVHCGIRAALNLAGGDIDAAAIRRGDWITAEPALSATSRFDVEMTNLGTDTLRASTPAHVHVGAFHATGRIALIGAPRLEPGSAAFAQVILDEPTAVVHGDRVILRNAAADSTIAAATVLDARGAAPRAQRRPERIAELEALTAAEPAARINGLLGASGVIDVTTVAANENLTPDQVRELIDAADAVVSGDTYATASTLAGVADLIVTLFKALPAEKPTLPQSRIERSLPVRIRGLARLAIDQLVAQKQLVASGNAWHLPGVGTGLSAREEATWKKIEAVLKDAGLKAPLTRELAAEAGLDPVQMLGFLKKATGLKLLAKVADNRYFLTETVHELARIAEEIAAREPLTARAYRDATDLGRNTAIEVLEYLDSRGFTKRDGNERQVIGDYSRL